jgi:hypothetical protein
MRIACLIAVLASGCYEGYTTTRVVRREPVATSVSTPLSVPAEGQRIVVVRADGRRQEGVIIRRDPISGRALVRVPDDAQPLSTVVDGRTNEAEPRVIVREQVVTPAPAQATPVVPERDRGGGAFAGWAARNPDAASALCDWSHDDPRAAAAVLGWEADHPGQARELIGWASQNQGASFGSWVDSHPGVADQSILLRNREAVTNFLEWSRDFPEAANALVDRPRALSAASASPDCGRR